MTVNIAMPIICLCYIKKNTVTEETQYRKGMAKFSLFLVLGGVIISLANLFQGYSGIEFRSTCSVMRSDCIVLYNGDSSCGAG